MIEVGLVPGYAGRTTEITLPEVSSRLDKRALVSDFSQLSPHPSPRRGPLLSRFNGKLQTHCPGDCSQGGKAGIAVR